MEVFWNVVGTLVEATVLCPFEVLLINISIAIADGTAKDVVVVAKDLDQGNSLWADLDKQQVNGILDETVISLLEPSKVVAGSHAFLQESEPVESAQSSQVDFQLFVLQLALQSIHEVIE